MDNINEDFIELYQTIGRSFGLDDVFNMIFAKLYIEPNEVAMDDLADETGYSLASICNKVKMLEAMGIIKKMRKPGSKKIFLYIEKDFSKLIKEHLVKKEEYCIKLIQEKVPDMINKYKNKAKSKRDIEKLKILENYYSQIIKFKKVIEHLRKDIENM